jgi:hypothetical protein
MPRHIASRLSSLKVKLKPDARTERIERLIAFVRPLENVKLILELTGLDDSDVGVLEKIKMFKGLPIHQLGLNKCNLQTKPAHKYLLQEPQHL